jgi:hypothetical protein
MPEQDLHAAEANHAEEVLEMVLPTNHESTEVLNQANNRRLANVRDSSAGDDRAAQGAAPALAACRHEGFSGI